MDRPLSRRGFLGLVLPLVAMLPLGSTPATRLGRTLRVGRDHPDPRPGITGAKVLRGDQLRGFEELTPTFEGISEFPHIADGLRCFCGCADLPEYRSLLTCYEHPAMALACEICQRQGQLVVRRAREGQTLAQIRRAVDARFGGGDHGSRAEHDAC